MNESDARTAPLGEARMSTSSGQPNDSAEKASEGATEEISSAGGAAPAATPPEATPPAPSSAAEAPSVGGEAVASGEAASEAAEGGAARGEAQGESEGGSEGEAAEGGEGAAAGAPGAPGTGKKRRRRRRGKGGGAGAPGVPGAEGAEGVAAEGEGAEGAAAEGEGEGGEGEGAEGKGGKRRGGPPRERPAFTIGEEVFGRVAKVTDNAVWIDIAGKAIGLFDKRQLTEGTEPPVEGDQFIATVASTGVRGGMLVLSRAPIDLDESKKTVEEAHKSGTPLEGFVTSVVKGGLEVDVLGLRAFAPASHVDLRHGADLSPMVGERLDFFVEQYAKKGRDVVVSRRKMLEEETRKARSESLAKLEPGSIHKGVVRKVVAWGVFVALPDADDVEGLVHMTEATHDRGARLHDVFKPGEEIEVKVLRVDEKGKLWLSRKAAVGDPWDAVRAKYAPGTRHKAKVARLQPFGAFVELESGIDGLIHTADLSYKQIAHPSEVVKEGEEIDVVVATCDAQHRRISLHPAPPPGEEEEPRQKVVPHKPVKCAVTQVVEGGLVVRILGVTGRTARAFIPAGQTGTQRGTDLRKEFPVGTKLDAKVLELDPRRGEAKLSIKALKEDTEKQAYQQYRAGVAREAKFGTFADLMKKS